MPSTSRQQQRVAHVHRIPQSSPDDISGLEALVQAGKIHVNSIVAILGKTEGNGCVNDFTRAFAVQSLQLWLGRHVPEKVAIHKVCLVMLGGTEGGISPHLIVMEVRQDNDGDEATAIATTTDEVAPITSKKQKMAAAAASYTQSLAIGVAHSPNLPYPDLGRVAQVQMVASTVRIAMAQAGITDPKDVHFVQIKCPLLTAARLQECERDGNTTATSDTLKSMKLSRGASALGVAVALSEFSMDDITNEKIGQDWSLFSSRASTSGGVELLNHEVVVLGMSSDWKGPLAVDHAVMKDAIDVESIRGALMRLGIVATRQLTLEQQEQVVCLLAKAEASSTGNIRGKRHIMLDDSDISATRHARGFVAGVIASLIGHTELFVSGGAEHQGPDGGGPVAMLVDRSGGP